MQCLRSICISGLHGGNGVNKQLWQWAERGAQAQRGGGGVCGGAKTSAIQPSLEPVSRTFSSSSSSSVTPPPLRSSPHPSLPPLCFWGSWTKEATQCSRLCGSRKTLLLSAWQTINTFTVLTGKSQTTTVLFGHSGNDRKALNVVHAQTHTHTHYSKMIFQGSKDSYWALLADFTDVCLTICRWCILFAPDGFLTAYIIRFETAANMTVMLRYLVHLFLFSSGSSYVRHTCKPAQ